MNIRYRVELSQDERDQLTALLSGGKHPARKIKRAQILLAADAGVGDAAIAASVSVGESTVDRTKRRFVEGNLDFALAEEARPGTARKLTGREEALLVATACSSPPAGCARWTLDLLAGEMVKLTEHATVSRETVRRRLAEKELKPWQKDMWCIPKVDGAYVARMENVLDLYVWRVSGSDGDGAGSTNVVRRYGVIGSVILMEARGRGGDLCGVPVDPTSHNCVMFESMRSERADHFRAARRGRSAGFMRGPR
jgi:transposase